MEAEMVLSITEHYVKEYVKCKRQKELRRLKVLSSVLKVLSPAIYKELKKE